MHSTMAALVLQVLLQALYSYCTAIAYHHRAKLSKIFSVGMRSMYTALYLAVQPLQSRTVLIHSQSC
jgi:hypothetical protein